MNYIKVAQFNIKNISNIIYTISYYKYTHVNRIGIFDKVITWEIIGMD
jgi:hypothetical protein